MLVLTRRIGEEIVIQDEIRLVVVSVQGNRIRFGIKAPPWIRVDRAEVHELRQAGAEADHSEFEKHEPVLSRRGRNP